ncbi:hypothetical protein [Hymenobacter cheonanensis]|uniref:hypothetical protein n=1 Tax=Hymenobacter sp. CA2-7 TaxID=3063993 RepID=UPI0027132BCF|nr:hypothetical protein [Hymenobacter sp. CA2-7]MDO7886693.1 hypothetical protein [Hymenobacter sp. CA2-7]
MAALLVLFVPFGPGHNTTLKVRYAHYACQPCSLGFAYSVAQVYRPTDEYLLRQAVVLYYRRGYFVEYSGHKLEDIDKLTRVLCRVRGRSLFDQLTDAPYAADVYKWTYR